VHLLIRGLVYAADERDAVATAEQDVFQPLVQDRTFDYYLTFAEDGRDGAGRDRLGPLRAAAPAETRLGEQLVESGWATTVDQYERHLTRIEQFFADHEPCAFWEDITAYQDYHQSFNSVGERQGPATLLYDQYGQGIRNRSQLADAYQPDAQTTDNEDLYVVPVDVHY